MFDQMSPTIFQTNPLFLAERLHRSTEDLEISSGFLTIPVK
jgi:hypothetical protein